MDVSLEHLLSQFEIIGEPMCCILHGNGHINETYRVECDNGRWYTLQRINTDVFNDPVSLMRNVQAVTAHIALKVKNPREVLCLIPTHDDQAYYQNADGSYWRMFAFVRDSVCLEHVESAQQFYESAVAFGRFQNRLADFPAEQLVETIPHFHDTPTRFSALLQAVSQDVCGRSSAAQAEIDFACARESYCHTFTDLQVRGELPLRVTHNDTKINNVLFDEQTMRGLCVIDLDTVMPGLAMNDFGDAIRFGANTAEEDATDPSSVCINLALYEAYVNGYLSTCGASLTPLERELLPYGAKMMTLECGMRFLSDHINGDTYFKIHRINQNLDRARSQFALVRDMERHWDDMRRITANAASL
ncbi:MAG: aminoglycoside phosphotransferase family protein [Clostridia bacterium]